MSPAGWGVACLSRPGDVDEPREAEGGLGPLPGDFRHAAVLVGGGGYGDGHGVPGGLGGVGQTQAARLIQVLHVDGHRDGGVDGAVGSSGVVETVGHPHIDGVLLPCLEVQGAAGADLS